MLKKVTKTIPLSGGQQDEAAEFMLEPPGMAYMENARFRKLDVAEKTEPLASLGTPGQISFLPPSVLFEDEDKLVTLGNDEVATYDGSGSTPTNPGSWSTTATPAEIIGIDQLLTTSEQANGVNFVWAPFVVYEVDDYDISGYCVVFERRTHGLDEPAVTIVIQRYLGTSLYDETVISGHCSPVIQPLQDGSCRLYFTKTFDASVYTIQVPLPPTAVPTEADTTLDAATIHQAYDANEQWNGLAHDALRPGFTRNARYHSAHKYKQPHTEAYGVIARKNAGIGAPDILYYETAANGNTTGSQVFVRGDVGASEKNVLLDVDIDDTYVYVLYASHDTTAANGDVEVWLQRHLRSTPTTVVRLSLFTYGGTVSQGSVKVASDGTCRVGFRAWGGNADEYGLNFYKSVGLYFYSVNSTVTTKTSIANLRDHMLASNIELDDNDNAVCVVQQASNTFPNNSRESANNYSSVPAAIKPVTSALVRVTTDGVIPIGTMDAGQSKDKEVSYSEQNIHYGNLYYVDKNSASWDQNFLYGNTVLLTAEDYLYYMSSTYNATPGESVHKKSLLIGEHKCSIYNMGPRVPRSASILNEAFAYNSAIPLWYTRGGLTELSVVDQPEIVGIECFQENGSITRADGPIMAYSPTATSDYRSLQPVVGFFDDGGNVHRSAPGFPVYIENAFEQTGYYLAYVSISVPLSFAGRSFFLEVYEAAQGDEPQLAATGTFTPSRVGVPQVLFVLLNTDQNKDFPRSSETLYTTGSVLPVDPWPNMEQVTSSSRRMFGISEAAPGTIFYSKIFEENVAPEFSASLVISTGGFRTLTAIGTVDDKVIIFEKDRMHYLYGSGPDNTGANGDFFVERLQTTLGCTDPQSLVQTPDGLMFYSSMSREFHMITRDLQVVDIGKPVMETSADIIVNASVLYQQEHEVRFYVTGPGSSDWGEDPNTDAGTPTRPPRPRYGRSTPSTHSIFVYNYHYKKWTIHSDLVPTAAACTYNNKPAILADNFSCRHVESELTGYLSYYKAMTWETPWIKVHQLQDYGRFYGATILGKYLSSWTLVNQVIGGDALQAGDLKVTIKYDYEGLNGDTDEYLFRANVDFDPTDGERLQFKVHPGRQKCQAVKFIIEEQGTTKVDDAEPNYTLGRGFELSGIDLHYGAKGGSSRNWGVGRQK